MELSVKFASQICHENINKPLDGTYLADFDIDIIKGQSDSSSIPSSYDPEKTLTQSGLTEFPQLMEKSVGQTFHNRGRRNAFANIILDDDKEDEKYPQFLAISQDQEDLDENDL